MIQEIINYAIAHNSSDIHICAENKIILRINGDLISIGDKILTKIEADNLVLSLMNENQKEFYSKNLEIDFAKELYGQRFRINAFKTNDGSAAVLRIIPQKIKTLEELRIPEAIKQLVHLKQGLILFTGPTGSGKSTSMAAIIDEINKNYSYHVITIEDPIEFIHKSQKSLISQRQIGDHSLSFQNSLRSALREDPNVILIGEMRDAKTIKLALDAAETGHLVLATLHTNSAAETIHRIVNVFEAENKSEIRSILASSLQAIISQRLIKSQNKRHAAFEIMLANSSIRNLIREDKIAQIPSIIELNKKIGMITLKDAIINLVKNNVINEKDAEYFL